MVPWCASRERSRPGVRSLRIPQGDLRRDRPKIEGSLRALHAGIAFEKSICNIGRTGLTRSVCSRYSSPGCHHCELDCYRPPSELLSEIRALVGFPPVLLAVARDG